MERVRRAEELGGRGWEGGPVWQPEAIRWMVPDGPCFPSEPGTCAYTGQGVRQCLADYKLLISNDLQSGCRAVVCSMGDIGLFFPRGGRRAVCTPPHNAGHDRRLQKSSAMMWGRKLVDGRRIELLTSALRTRRSPS